MIFPETATQLSKPKKKSTYSDAVGKKNDVSVGGGSGGGGVGGQGNKMSQLGGSNGGGGGGPGYSSGSQGPSIVPPQQQQQQQPQQQHKLNLAPGSRPNMGDKVIACLHSSPCSRENINFSVEEKNILRKKKFAKNYFEQFYFISPGC